VGFVVEQSRRGTWFSRVSIILPWLSILIYISSGMNNRPVGICSSETWSKLIDMNNKNNGKLNIVETLITFIFKRFDLLSIYI
jgi:hypothetical protein